MSMIKEREYNDFDDDDTNMEEDEDFIDSDIELEDETDLLAGEENIRFRRSWRDTEKYKEMRELYKLINDELYTGFYEEDFLEDEGR